MPGVERRSVVYLVLVVDDIACGGLGVDGLMGDGVCWGCGLDGGYLYQFNWMITTSIRRLLND